ncbi:MAG: energy transducer TonB, partial [Myxococcales bacterium]|nr:energy transducer TonB [Myxococcales bacterium]
DFDQTHILTAIASYKLPKGWQIGARFRLVSGNPTTPVLGAIYDASTNGYIAINGPRNSARVPAFHQLDVRVDRRWVYRRLTTTAYLDILNIYNAQNTEFINYSYNFQASAPVTSLPILPSIGLKIEW